ncbi:MULTISPECIES: DUF2262 domain-containing protein [Megasphaera]|uniref:DUF2262 domain-containing protein n=1 Tax=Megasphaera vaginalis (ex Srinivasan et al. 2021) TaxID=1111454 RepID=U7UM88_9FIRM|nr:MULTISPECIES: hypothetical protein [Megasphaera]ERT60406.1 hypothetical protein HMPREF1250_0309 [Megasphaera vaginalis (ex Srinivasan et al. 2021)]
MNLEYVKGSYLDEIMFENKPVLFTLEGLGKGKEEEACRYGQEIWDWILAHRSRVMAHAPLIAKFKNEKWRCEWEDEITPEQVRSYLSRINSVYVTYGKGFDIFFDTSDIFQEHSIVVSMGKNFLFKGFRLL